MSEHDPLLGGIKVVDLSRWIAGPHAALMLGDLGADVVKVEPPQGDASRQVTPHINGESTYFMALNRSKRGICLDLRSTEGRDVLRRLLTRADVLIENFRPGTLEEMGLGEETLAEINPRLVVASISGWGQDGPKSREGMFDSIAQSVAGLQAVTGWPNTPPVKAGFYVADYAAALHTVIGVLAALISRSHSEQGRRCDIALVESLLSMSATLVPGYLGADVVPERQGNRSVHAYPADCFEASDGWVNISASTDKLFAAMTSAMERPDLLTEPRFATNAARVTNAEDLAAIIGAWAAELKAAEVEERLKNVGVPVGRVASIETAVVDEQLQHRRFFQTIDHPRAGKVGFAGPVVRTAGVEQELRPSPGLGQHTHEVLSEWLRMSTDTIETLRTQGIACGGDTA